jgi:hypothetical protein
MEDTFMPAAVANAQKKQARNMLRFIVTTPRHMASVPTSRVANAIGTALIGLLKLFGVKAFDPVYDWDRPRSS